MRTVTYDEVLNLAARLAGRASDTTSGGLALPTSEAAMLRDFIADHLPVLWAKEAWPELCNDFEEEELTNGQFTKDDETYGDVLSIYIGGNPQTTTVCTKLNDWVETDGAVRVTTELTGTLYVEYQDPITELPDYGDSDLGTTELPARFKFPLARLAAADLIEDEDAGKAERLRNRAARDLNEQASRIAVPWWRR